MVGGNKSDDCSEVGFMKEEVEKTGSSETLPLARNKRLVIKELAEETLVYDLDRDKAHCLNQTAGQIWQLCDGKKSAGDIAREMEARTGAPVAEAIVMHGIQQLSEARLIESGAPSANGAGKISRRELIRKAGLVAVIALPAVTSIVAPTPVEAGASCAVKSCSLESPPGQPDPQCPPGLHCDGFCCVP